MAREITPEEIVMVDELVARARVAADIIATYDEPRLNRLCQAVAAALYDLKVWGPICDEAVDETRLGDKVTKRNKRNKLKLILRVIHILGNGISVTVYNLGNNRRSGYFKLISLSAHVLNKHRQMQLSSSRYSKRVS